MTTKLRIVAVVAVLLVAAVTARALINPNFTPLDLVKQSDMILMLEVQKVTDEGMATAKVTKVIKGNFDKKEVTIDLNASLLAEVAGKKMHEIITAGQKEGLLFIGTFQNSEDPTAPPSEEQGAYLHMAGEWTDNSQNEWFILNGVPDDISAWDMGKLDENMLGTWNGGTDMLLRCVNYILADTTAKVPCASGVTWAPEVKVDQLSGHVTGMAAIDLTGKSPKGLADLFIADDSGDKLYRSVDGKMTDITAKTHLASKSALFAWGDFNADGTLDLASYDGKAITIHAQQADGTFVATPCDTGDTLAGGVLGLTTFSDAKGHAALLASTKGLPVRITFTGGKAAAGAMAIDAMPGNMGDAAPCLVADFDNDGLPDILQMFSRGGLFYKGSAPGDFAGPVITLITAGEGHSVACLGDFDADGLPDIWCSAEDRNRMWHNLGGGKFINLLVASGEIFYHPKAGGSAVEAGDFNNDGRIDALITYNIQQKPHLFFNRGFRSFGQAYTVDLDQLNRLDASRDGQQAGGFGDFNGDGALDMVLVLKNGEVWLFPRKVDKTALAVRAVLPLGGLAGPVNVCAFKDDRPLGAQVVRAGESGAFFGIGDVGPIVLKWKTPDGKEHETLAIVEVEQSPVRVELKSE